MNMSADYEEQANRIKTVISNLKAELHKTENGIDEENPFLATFRKHENIEALTRELLIELVEHIKIYEGGDIAVRFKHGDDMRHVWEFIEVNMEVEESIQSNAEAQNDTEAQGNAATAQDNTEAQTGIEPQSNADTGQDSDTAAGHKTRRITEVQRKAG